ncbi:TIGR03790 family protein [Fontisphaera persica]|uniref:TIGR03790 family protein n=1 Tax=Fontisphaera persica TaxID=2974023 RepID=UPI0024BFAC6B|nr:TIGR03790 family protein [Fontisphaera persica]WCJ59226.1 TIGR03790 family protein [Fontisphaera persica]
MIYNSIISFWLMAVALGVFSLPAVPATPNEAASVVVVYNRDLPDSRRVAEYYATRRGVPPDYLLGLSLPKTETMSRAEYDQQLRAPLLRWLTENRHWKYADPQAPAGLPVQASIRFAVLCYGVPLKIRPEPALKEPAAAALPPALQRNEAAVDSELACLPGSVTNYLIAGALPNPFHGATNVARLHPTNGLLLVTRLDGPSAEIARGLVDQALAAETNGLWGRAYLDLRQTTDTNYALGDRWLATTAQMLWRMGYWTEVDTNAATFSAGYPMSHIAFYAGWYDEHVSGPFTLPEVEFMPGAFVYHLHSFSAASVRNPLQHWAGPLLAKGAAATIGFTDEPYLAGTLDVPTFTANWLGVGATFAEAAYAAQGNLSWQTTVIGDPLYRPAARRPEERHADLAARNSSLIEWSHAKVVVLNLATGLSPLEIMRYLENLTNTASSAVLTEMLADLYWQNRKLLDGLYTTESALQRGPSPQQKVRLYLKTAERLQFLQRYPQRLACLEALVKEFPDHPRTAEVKKEMAELKAKLAKPSP